MAKTLGLTLTSGTITTMPALSLKYLDVRHSVMDTNNVSTSYVTYMFTLES